MDAILEIQFLLIPSVCFQISLNLEYRYPVTKISQSANIPKHEFIS